MRGMKDVDLPQTLQTTTVTTLTLLPLIPFQITTPNESYVCNYGSMHKRQHLH